MLSCPDFSHCHVVVVGDIMLDRYWQGDTSRISPEAPVPVVKIEETQDKVGGAANVAMNVRALGANVTLVGVIGIDGSAQTIKTLLNHQQIECHFIESSLVRTTLKLRVLGRHQQLIRLDFEDKYPWPAETILNTLKPLLNNANVLILSDYAKGVLENPLPIIHYARSLGIKVLVDPKRADLQAYKGAYCLTPNLGEFEAAVGKCRDQQEIEEKGKNLLKALALESLLVTQGSRGMTLFEANGMTTHIPTRAKEVFDITGAGDTVIGVLGTAMASNVSMKVAAQLANVAAGLSVAKLGAVAVSKEELSFALEPSHSFKGIVSFPALKEIVNDYKKKQRKIVMTNGCFDILHVGHITYLKQARALGDCLIIAVNDDASIKRLKGANRPINSLTNRLQMLAALECVDYVVPFSEDTPEKLIEQILPDILAKGGDYTPEQIAGSRQVMANGGSVEIIPLVPGLSTTHTIEKLKVAESVL